ncbi:MAG: sulfotransferase domain-containing protein, partial [Chloroflexota bacterium]
DFGNWSKSARRWKQRAQTIIRYEDLILDPINTIERLRAIVDLPVPTPENIPSFEELKNSKKQKITQSVPMSNTKKKPQRREHFFRRGIAGAWKDEMPDDLHKLFWKKHKEMMVAFGYTDGMPKDNIFSKLFN